MTNRTTPAQCSLAFFYASWCPFSARAAPHFNGLARHFPDMKMYAIDTSDFHTMNTQFGIMALPTLILFHNSKAVAKYNQSEFELENFAKRKYSVTMCVLPSGLVIANFCLEAQLEFERKTRRKCPYIPAATMCRMIIGKGFQLPFILVINLVSIVIMYTTIFHTPSF